MGTGAIETKATLASVGFPARIGSIEQLDDSIRTPLFIAGARLSRSESGRSLPEFAGSLKAAMNGDAEANRNFADRLLAAGYHESQADRYSRRFAVEEMRVMPVENGFPRIVPGNVPEGVRNVTYEIDLDRAPGPAVDLINTLTRLGVI